MGEGNLIQPNNERGDVHRAGAQKREGNMKKKGRKQSGNGFATRGQPARLTKTKEKKITSKIKPRVAKRRIGPETKPRGQYGGTDAFGCRPKGKRWKRRRYQIDRG